MSLFIRRYLSDPGNEVFLEIEQVAILDLEPPASISGVGSGTTLIVGEFENGLYNKPTEVASVQDLSTNFGTLGYTYGGVPGNYPSALVRNADSAITPEYWNGNGFVQLNGKKFARLVICRVDTSIGAVTFSREAFLTGAQRFAYNLEPGQQHGVDMGAGSVTATFSATAATVTSAAGTYPTTFVGGEELVLSYDGKAPVTVSFLAADQSLVQVIARINSFFGFEFADSPAANLIRFTGLQRGNEAAVKIVSGTPAVITALGLTVGTTLGTGNVANIDSVKFNEIKTVVEAAISGTVVELDAAGRLRHSKTFADSGDYMKVTVATASALGFTVGQFSSNNGLAYLTSSAMTIPTLFAGGETVTFQVDDLPQFTVTFLVGDQTRADVITAINTAAGYAFATADTVSAVKILYAGKKNGGKVRVVAASAPTVLTKLGLSETTVQATAVTSGTIPAGTLIATTAGTQLFVTTQDTKVVSSSVGPYTARIRHAIDDGTGTSATAGTVTNVMTPPTLGSFDCVNPSPVSACMTEGQIDAAYSTAYDSTKSANTISRVVNLMYSARQSNACRRNLRSNVISASANGLFGRMAFIRPPLNTDKNEAKSDLAEPGVGAYRDQRVVYCYPGASSYVPYIGQRGSGAGVGFTDDGIVDIGFDGFVASICSQLAPEENPGQLTSFATGIVGVESGSNVQDFEEPDYVAFKAAGMCVLRMDDGTAIAQSGVTSVDPSVFPNLKNIARRRMADYIQDTLARRCKSFGKKLNTQARRKALAAEIRAFLVGLLSVNTPASQRIAGFTIDEKSGNTAATIAQGIFRIIVNVRTLSSMDAIVLATTVGESVTVDEVLPQAA